MLVVGGRIYQRLCSEPPNALALVFLSLLSGLKFAIRFEQLQHCD